MNFDLRAKSFDPSDQAAAGLPFLIETMRKTRREIAWVCAWNTRKKNKNKKQKLIYSCDLQHVSGVK